MGRCDVPKPNIEPLESRIAPAVFIVTNTANSGLGSLPAALLSADNSPGHDTIIFHIPPLQNHLVNTINLTNLTGLHSDGNVSIVGPGAGNLIINGNDETRILLINDGNALTSSPTTISGISFVNGNAGANNGGGIFSDEPLTLKNVVVSNCAAAGGAGVAVGDVPASHLKVNISNSLITGNSASSSGGGLSLYDLDSLKISNTVITGNAAVAHGAGGLYVEMNTTGTGMAITNCLISGNTADHGGGLFINSYSTNAKAKIVVSGTTINGNSTTSASVTGGGGLYIQQGAAVIVTGSKITANTSANDGGGIEAKGVGSLTISKTLISGNAAASVGGGFNIFGNNSVALVGDVVSANVDTSTVHGAGGGYVEMNAGAAGITITGCQIGGNTANHGGGLFVNSYGTSAAQKITISATKITGNVSTATGIAGGGGLYVEKGNTVITGSVISNNTSSGYNGGGIEAKGFNVLAISKSTITGNQALQVTPGDSAGGGGIYLNGNGAASPATANITQSIFSGNTSASYGGGIAAADSVGLTITKSVFSSNRSSTAAGGAVSTYGKNADLVNLTISGSTFTGNMAARHGGAIGADGSGLISISGSKLTGNAALATAGGGIDIDGATQVTLTNDVVTHNSCFNFGGGLEMINTIAFQIAGGSFTGNTAGTAGGAMDFISSTGSITGVVIAGNEAGTQGGGVNQRVSGTVTLQIATVSGNISATGSNIAGTITLV